MMNNQSLQYNQSGFEGFERRDSSPAMDMVAFMDASVPKIFRAFLLRSKLCLCCFPLEMWDRKLTMVAFTHLLIPSAMLSSMIVLSAFADGDRERRILAGVNVLKPYRSPQETRTHYRHYENKLSEGMEQRRRLQSIGYDTIIAATYRRMMSRYYKL